MLSRVNYSSGIIMVASFVLVIAMVLAQAAVAYFVQPKAVIHLNSQRFEARVADTEKSRKQGLSGTDSLAADQAMLFVNDYDSRHGIWMEDMNYSIDIVWLDSQKKIVHIETNVSPDSYPKVFFPNDDSRYIIELKSGTVKSRGIRIGQEAVFSGTSKEL